jgi:hypothetical protein
VVAENDDATIRLARGALFQNLYLGAQAVAGEDHGEEARVLDGNQSDDTVGEQVPRHRGGERHDEVAWADALRQAAGARVGIVQEDRHFIADEAAERFVVGVRDGAHARGITRSHLEVVEIAAWRLAQWPASCNNDLAKKF